MKWAVVTISVISIVSSGCNAHRIYDATKVGEFRGVLEIRWLEPDRFLFVPSKKNPLRYRTGDGNAIEPKPMYTDGGSIPRIFWSVPGYSPWGLGPAYIIHDWLFMAHHCQSPGYQHVSFEDSAGVMGEAIKTLMESKTVPKDETVFFNVVQAVKSPIAKEIWDDGKCDLPPDELVYGRAGDVPLFLAPKLLARENEFTAVQSELTVTKDPVRKLELEAKAVDLRRRLDQDQRLLKEATKKEPGTPAARLLFTIDMGTTQKSAPIK